MKELVTAYLQAINPWFVVSVILMLGVLVLFLAGCAGRYYEDNPRNMQNMTADQLKRELGVK